jgi:hypothetical protein
VDSSPIMGIIGGERERERESYQNEISMSRKKFEILNN